MTHLAIDKSLARSSDDLHTRLAEFAHGGSELRRTEDVLNALHMVSTSSLPLNVLGALRLPVKSLDWDTVELGKSVFLHDEVPDGWWRE